MAPQRLWGSETWKSLGPQAAPAVPLKAAARPRGTRVHSLEGASQTPSPEHRASTFTPNFIFPPWRGHISTSRCQLRESSVPLPKWYIYTYTYIYKKCVCLCVCTHWKCIPGFDSASRSPHLWKPPPPTFPSHICALNIDTKSLHSWGNFCQKGLLLLPFLAPRKKNDRVAESHIVQILFLQIRWPSCMMKVSESPIKFLLISAVTPDTRP